MSDKQLSDAFCDLIADCHDECWITYPSNRKLVDDMEDKIRKLEAERDALQARVKELIANALRYLELIGKLERHPERPELVMVGEL